MNIINAIADYFRSAKNELSKVTWPSKEQTTRYSILVIGSSLAIAIFFGAMDIGLSRLVTASLANKNIQAAQPAQTPTTQPNTVDLGNVQVDAQTQSGTVQPTVEVNPTQNSGADNKPTPTTPQL